MHPLVRERRLGPKQIVQLRRHLLVAIPVHGVQLLNVKGVARDAARGAHRATLDDSVNYFTGACDFTANRACCGAVHAYCTCIFT
jgi:hypothetical protein